MSKRTASPAEVRSFAVAAGLQVGSRGRFSPEVVRAFNKAHKGLKYTEAAFKPLQKVTAKPGKGTPRTRNINIAEARAWANANGYNVGERGRLAANVKQDYVLSLSK